MTKPTRMALLRQYRRHAHVVAYAVLAVGVLIAVLMIQNEVDDRSTEDRVIKGQISEEAERRLSANEKQIADLEQTNRVQNQILRALLAAERRDPELFGGVDLPRLAGMLDQVEPSRRTSTATSSSISQPLPTVPVRPETALPTPRPPSEAASPSGRGDEQMQNTPEPPPSLPVATAQAPPAPAVENPRPGCTGSIGIQLPSVLPSVLPALDAAVSCPSA